MTGYIKHFKVKGLDKRTVNETVFPSKCSHSLNSCTYCINPSLTQMQKTMLQYTFRCIWTWLNSFSTDRRFCNDEHVGEYRLRPLSQSLHSAAVQSSTECCSTFITRAGCTGSCLAHWLHSSCQSVGNNWGLLARKYIICLRTPTKNKWNSCTTAVWKTKELICDIDTDMNWLTGWDFTQRMMAVNS